MITANHNAPHRRQQWGTVILRFKQLWSRYQTQYSILAGYQLLIRKKDQGERGVFYAAQLGPFSRDDANQLCNKLKSAGGTCFIQRN
jgi:SPOR domain